MKQTNNVKTANLGVRVVCVGCGNRVHEVFLTGMGRRPSKGHPVIAQVLAEHARGCSKATIASVFE